MRKLPTEYRARVEELEESVWSVVRQENEREDQGEGVHNSGKTSTYMYGAETLYLKKAQGKKLEVAEIRMVQCGVTKLDKIRN